MPLDITPTPTTSVPAGTTATTGTAAPGLAPLFGLLLAQTVGQTATAAPGGSVKTPIAVTTSQPLVTGNSLIASTQPAVKTSVVKTDPTADKPKDKSKALQAATQWPLLVPATITLVPNENPVPVTTPKAMDTAPNPGGELLPTNATTSAQMSVPTPRVISPAESTEEVVPTVRASAQPLETPAELQAVLPQVPQPQVPQPQVPQPQVPQPQVPQPQVPQPQSHAPQAVQPNVIVPSEPRTASISNVIVPTESNGISAASISATPETPLVPGIAGQQAEEMSLTRLPASPPSPVVGSARVPLGAKTTNLRSSSAPKIIGTPAILQKIPVTADNQAGADAGKNASLDTQVDTVSIGPNKSTSDKTGTGQTLPKASAEGTTPLPSSPVPTVAVTKQPEAAQVVVTAMPVADRTQMLRQVSDGLQTMAVHAAGNGQRQVTLQLHPKDWGQVNVSVTMTPTTRADGKVSTQVVAHVVAEQPAVKAALETHQADLRQSLKEVGLDLNKLTITVRPAEGGAQAGLGEGRRESRGGEGAAFSPQSGTSAQSSGAGGGGNPSAFAAFGQGAQSGQGRQQAPPDRATVPQDVPVEPDIPTIRTTTGRVDTRA